MLVLSRKPQETIEFPDLAVSVRLLRCSGKQAQLGVDAPRSIRVLRGELQPDDLRTLPLETHTSQAFALLQQLEMQVAALAELSTAADRPMAASVAEDAQQALQRVRRHVLLAGKRLDSPPLGRAHSLAAGPTTQPSSVRQGPVEYAIKTLANIA